MLSEKYHWNKQFDLSYQSNKTLSIIKYILKLYFTIGFTITFLQSSLFKIIKENPTQSKEVKPGDCCQEKEK